MPEETLRSNNYNNSSNNSSKNNNNSSKNNNNSSNNNSKNNSNNSSSNNKNNNSNNKNNNSNSKNALALDDFCMSETNVHVRNVDVQKQRLHQKLKNSKTYRQKFILTAFLWYTGMTCGWISGQVGPSLLDLQIITGSSFETVSKLLTVGSVGFLIGSILGGFVFSRLSSHLILSISLFCTAVFTAALPWCAVFELMAGVMFIRQICLAVTDTDSCQYLNKDFGRFSTNVCEMQDAEIINAELLCIWRLKNKSYMQALHFSFAIGGILSPIVTAPFLTPNVKTSLPNSSYDHSLERMTTTSETAFNLSNSRIFGTNNKNQFGPHKIDNFDLHNFVTTSTCCVRNNSDASKSVGSVHKSANQRHANEYRTITEKINNVTLLLQNKSIKSRIFVAFTITSTLALSGSILYLVLFLTMRSKKRKLRNPSEETEISTMSRSAKILILIVMLALLGVYNAIEESFAGFVATFCVKQLKWSKTFSSIATSVFWATFGGGRFSGIFLIRLCSPARMIDIYGVFSIIAFIGLLVSSLENCDVAVWICIVLIGVSLSVFSPTIFTWTEEIIHVTGTIASGLKVAANAGSMVNSVILGILIDRYTPLWLCYLLLGECVFIFFLCIIATFYTKRIKAKRYTKETNIT